MQVEAKGINAKLADILRKEGGSHKVIRTGKFVPGTDAWELAGVVITLPNGSQQEGDEYVLPHGIRAKVDRNGTFVESEWAE